MESPISQKASDQVNVAVGEKNLLEFEQDDFMPNAIESLGHIKKESCGLLVLAAGLRHILDESQQKLSRGMRLSEGELFENYYVQSLKITTSKSYTTLHETLEDFRRGGKKAYGP